MRAAQAQEVNKKLRGARLSWPVIGALVFFGWIAYICYGIATEKPEIHGTKSVSGLREKMQSALDARDPDSLAEVVDPDTAGSDYGTQLIARIQHEKISDVKVSVSKHEDTQLMLITGSDAAGGPVCEAWPIVKTGDKWTVSTVPLLASGCPVR